MEKQLYSNFWCNSVDKGAIEIFACFKREIKNRTGRSSLFKALPRPVKNRNRFSVHIFKIIWRNEDVQKRDIEIIHHLKETSWGEKTGRILNLYLSTCYHAQSDAGYQSVYSSSTFMEKISISLAYQRGSTSSLGKSNSFMPLEEHTNIPKDAVILRSSEIWSTSGIIIMHICFKKPTVTAMDGWILFKWKGVIVNG